MNLKSYLLYKKGNPLFLKYLHNELPSGYKKLKDIIFDGESYFITNYKLKGSDTLRFTFNSTQNGTNVLGCFNGTEENDNFSLYHTTGSGGAYVRYNGELSRVKARNLNFDYNVVISPTGVTGLDESVSWDTKEFTSRIDFYIGYVGNATSSPFIGILKGDIIIDGKAKYIACERLSDGTIGYYDTYSKTFFVNQGTGTVTTSGYYNSEDANTLLTNTPFNIQSSNISSIYLDDDEDEIDDFDENIDKM